MVRFVVCIAAFLPSKLYWHSSMGSLLALQTFFKILSLASGDSYLEISAGISVSLRSTHLTRWQFFRRYCWKICTIHNASCYIECPLLRSACKIWLVQSLSMKVYLLCFHRSLGFSVRYFSSVAIFTVQQRLPAREKGKQTVRSTSHMILKQASIQKRLSQSTYQLSRKNHTTSFKKSTRISKLFIEIHTGPFKVILFFGPIPKIFCVSTAWYVLQSQLRFFHYLSRLLNCVHIPFFV